MSLRTLPDGEVVCLGAHQHDPALGDRALHFSSGNIVLDILRFDLCLCRHGFVWIGERCFVVRHGEPTGNAPVSRDVGR